MANFLEDGIAQMIATVLDESSEPCGYAREGTLAPDAVSMHKRPQPPITVEDGSGGVTEILLTDFITNPTLLPYGDPLKGDEITTGDELYSVQSRTGTKVFKEAANAMIRIHTVRIR